MAMTTLLPVLAAVAFVAMAVIVAVTTDPTRPNVWPLPAALSAAFLVFSLCTVVTEGPVGFWVEHTRNLWGNQIWLDLLLAVGLGWTVLVPEARRLGVRPLPWLALILCTGSIGFSAMLARVLYLKGRRA